MGIGLFKISSSVYDANIKPIASVNPNPHRFNILRSQQVGLCLVLEVRYPDCTNYEGRKIMVFENTTLEHIEKQEIIDPHFFPSGKKFKSPIARLEPTERGWKMAILLAALYK